MNFSFIKDCNRTTRLAYTLLIDVAITIIAALMMPGALSGYYNNIIIESPTIFYTAPDSLLSWCPILDVTVFLILLPTVYIALWFVAYSAKEEETN